MTDETQTPTRLPSDAQPPAVEVRDAQAVADGAGTGGRPAPAPGADADLELLRGLVAAYGADGVRRMIDSLE
jgi:hypothetical protein